MYATQTFFVCILIGISACQVAPLPGPTLRGEPTLTQARGDWDDLDAAVSLATQRTELAVLERLPHGPDRVEYRLLTPREEPGELIAQRRDGVIHLHVRIGRWGRPELERRFLDHLRRRLAQLQGVDAAPAR